MQRLITTIGIMVMTLSFNIKAEDYDTAMIVCEMIDSTGVMSADCEISGGKRTLNLSFAADVSTAKTACNMIATASKDKGFIFDRPWKIVITSPYSNGNQIASCSLPSRSR